MEGGAWVVDVGEDPPPYMKAAAEEVAKTAGSFGILFGGSGQGEAMEVVDLGLPGVAALNVAAPEMMTLKEAEVRHIQYVLQRCDGNKTQACKVLGIGRATLYSKLGAD